MSAAKPLPIIRNLLREVARLSKEKPARLKSSLYGHVIAHCRSNQLTAAKYCRSPDEMLYLADTFLQYLRAIRYKEHLKTIYGKGERSVEDTAKLVGLRLPRTPTDVDSKP